MKQRTNSTIRLNEGRTLGHPEYGDAAITLQDWRWWQSVLLLSRARTNIPILAVTCAVYLCLAGCALPFSSSPSSPAGNFHAGVSQNGTTMMLHPGQTLLVTLGSTYWSFQGSSDLQVLAPVGAPSTSAGQCRVPGCGAGTVSQEFRANAPGTAQVTASRVSCGEALACNPGGVPEHYQLTVTVTAASP